MFLCLRFDFLYSIHCEGSFVMSNYYEQIVDVEYCFIDSDCRGKLKNIYSCWNRRCKFLHLASQTKNFPVTIPKKLIDKRRIYNKVS